MVYLAVAVQLKYLPNQIFSTRAKYCIVPDYSSASLFLMNSYNSWMYEFCKCMLSISYKACSYLVEILFILSFYFFVGFTGTHCETNINDCQSSPCHHGQCIDGTNSFICMCDPGYKGLLCQTQINECLSNPCQHGGLCEDLVNGYQCRCRSGTSGPNCEYNINECSSNPCRNGATCVDGINSYTCECVPGYTGIFYS